MAAKAKVTTGRAVVVTPFRRTKASLIEEGATPMPRRMTVLLIVVGRAT